jgi:hypothetical protein
LHACSSDPVAYASAIPSDTSQLVLEDGDGLFWASKDNYSYISLGPDNFIMTILLTSQIVSSSHDVGSISLERSVDNSWVEALRRYERMRWRQTTKRKISAQWKQSLRWSSYVNITLTLPHPAFEFCPGAHGELGAAAAAEAKRIAAKDLKETMVLFGDSGKGG